MPLDLVLNGKTSPVGDFEVVRALPQRERRLVGPFCFIDHMGPHTAVGTGDSGVGPHPHIGLATVTWLFEGEVLHRDSLGTAQLIRPGDVNWMTAGRGIVHSERTPAHLQGVPSTMEGLQVWVGLPLDQEEAEPSFQHVPKAELPAHAEGGVDLRVVLGSWRGARSPVRLASPTLYVIAELEAGAELVIPPEARDRGVYVVSGDVGVDGAALSRYQLGVLTPGGEATLTALTPSRVAVFGGEPLEGPRHMWWNFVSSRRERLEQAKADWKHRRFPLVPGDEHARIPMPGEDAIA
jgi:redox-sensitive bicupin YhaK (pirin superfamily)